MPYDVLDEKEWPDEEEDDLDDSSADLLQCPSCGAAVHEETQRCPNCGEWITPVHSAPTWRRAAWFIGALIVILGLILAAIR